MNHGNALSVYFDDPEGNVVECYLDTPHQIAQPHGDPLDLDLPDDDHLATNRRRLSCRPHLPASRRMGPPLRRIAPPTSPTSHTYRLKDRTPMDISCAFPTTMTTPEHVKIAEDLGYHRAWLYDTPQQSPDVWMILALAAAKTTRISLGPGVLIPSLRHPMVNAAATAALDALAPGRVVIGFGTGFTGRRAMGYGPMTWASTLRYIDAYTALLRGETIEWEGATMRMMHPDGSAPARPIEVPIMLSAFGPKGCGIASDRGYGLFGLPGQIPADTFDWVAAITWGTVRDDGDIPGGEHDMERIGAGASLAYHHAYEFGGPDAVAPMPGGEAWLEVINRHPAGERHLAVHSNHLLAMNDADRAGWNAGGSVLADVMTVTGTADEVRAKVAGLGQIGVTEIAYQPMGTNIPRELERFINAASQ